MGEPVVPNKKKKRKDLVEDNTNALEWNAKTVQKEMSEFHYKSLQQARNFLSKSENNAHLRPL